MRDAASLRNGNKRVEVEWIDSASESGWNDENDVLEKITRDDATLCLSVGYLVYEDDAKITLASNLATYGMRGRLLGDCITIPKVAITDGPRDLRR